MWIIQLFLAWALLYFVFRWILFGGKDGKGDAGGKSTGKKANNDRNRYFTDVPDALRPDIEPDEFDPSDWI